MTILHPHTIVPTIKLAKKDRTWTTAVTEELLREIVQRITTAFGVDKIILFGSYAYGRPTVESDMDLLVIMREHQNKSVFARNRLIHELFPQRRFALDVLVRSPQELRERLQAADSFFVDICQAGRVLYEKQKSDRVGQQSRGRLRNSSRSVPFKKKATAR